MCFNREKDVNSCISSLDFGFSIVLSPRDGMLRRRRDRAFQTNTDKDDGGGMEMGSTQSDDDSNDVFNQIFYVHS